MTSEIDKIGREPPYRYDTTTPVHVPQAYRAGPAGERFMILIGTMNLTRTREQGQYYCPTCHSTQEYRLRARRPFLTLYFIPVVPIGDAELFVQCSGCRDKWDPTVLEMNKQEHESIQVEQFRDEAMRSALLIVLEDGTTSRREIKTLQAIANQLLDRRMDREELGELCSIAQQNGIRAHNYVLTVSRRWTQSQKAEALGAMFLAATAEGKLQKPQSKALAGMRDVLEMTEKEYETAIEAALHWEPIE
ncbi:zinc ribbon domain-containing protein [Stieleria sp. TO1_6]|uniref:zinc-ribbon domain-containing protein n=1 Tax=Stieleria tagensis TaxID=2956795 RepID=UPI00209AFC20|nr:zinc ribbon domain-containing protein [Stieleria tagensis]MCO8124962.1 zinc ribbon domain-containing protein [Stieleria tagensis]